MRRQASVGQIRLASSLLVALALASATGVAYGQAGQVGLDTVRAGRFDFGKMWTFEYAPSEYFTETYGFDANAAWFARARLAALRVPGCSASFVSPHGLLVTNHHCVRSAVARVTRDGESLLDDGFVATTIAEERRIADYYADQLIEIEDVSDEVFAVLDVATSEPERETARRTAFSAVEARLRARHADLGDAVHVQVISLYHGGRYSAYVFRRFTDVRLVVAAELQMGFFGGDPDNFTYPRYDLDFAFLRIYDEQGRPYATEHFFGWSELGVEEGDVVFVIGNPGPTNRLSTIAQLEFQRDVLVPVRLQLLASRHGAMAAYRKDHPAEAEALGIRNRMFSLSNSLKANTGRLEALRTPVIMAKKRDAERQLREAIRGRADLQARFGMVLDRLAEIQQDLRGFEAGIGAFSLFPNTTYGSRTLARAMAVAAYLNAKNDGLVGDRLVALRQEALAIGDHPQTLEQRFMAARFADFARYFGAEDAVTRAALDGRAATDAAATMLAQSVLGDSARTAAALEADALDPDDPGVRLGVLLLPRYLAYQSDVGRLSAEERALAGELGRARFAVYGQSIPPDATRSPRITDGVVKRYEYNGTIAPPYTTFFGLYDRYASHGPGTKWDLPERWRTPPPGLDLRTPLNFVSTADTYGGNSGSPAVTPELAVVGLNFDRNIQGLSRDFIYLPEQGRNVMVDVRAILAALDHVYDADRIALEVTTHRLFETEEAADAGK